ncbi:amino acid adenylation domain-containing protein [Streptomyces europaeiscabiei]|uniref:non-ribosomal peptide synthetase n=1 Tax=Streptomyces europaeiscabiei TaxID=146819 RepID=UPI0029BD1B76|nr:non-ribosomal peptide synthetase [Streptomyces europaeiscabiei]MDX3629212.1 amino acid adenylation domain-containing protein [Streptomyces europaeiscabiei]MDX3647170.1 amino acid adenylation domain-containing protein [Streptomyces europaeiscabiei]
MTAPTAPNREELAAELLRRRLAARAGGRRAVPAGIPRADRSAPLVLSAGQRSLWFLHQLDPDSPEYLLPMVYRLRGPLDTGALRRAFDTLAARHEILRTRYVLDGTEPRQVIDPAGPADFAVVRGADADADADADTDGRAVAFAEEQAARPIDLAAEQPLRVRLLRLAADDHVLVAVVHHIACDAMTRPLLLSDLSALYTAAVEGRDPAGALPEPAVQYADYAAWLTERDSSPAAAADLAWWRERLAGLAPLGLPTDRPRPAVRDGGGATTRFEVPAPVAEKLRGLARDEGVTAFMVLLGAWQLLLGRYAGTTDVCVGTASSGRTRPELRQMAGYAYNTLALRAAWRPGTPFRRFLADSRTAVLAAYDHQGTPFDRIADEVEPERDLSTTPVFQVMFDLVSGEGGPEGLELPGVTVAPVPAQSRVSRFDLTLHLAERPDGTLHGSLEYATALFDAATAERITRHYRTLLAAIARAPGTPVADLDVLDAAERALLLDGPAVPVGTDRPLELAALRPVFETIAAQMAATPDAPALRHDGTTVTYAELDARADRFARRLTELGAGPEAVVAVLLDRGPDLVAALLGIWRAGAAHLPVDPAHPDDRVAHMLATTATTLAVTETRYAGRFTGVRTVVVDDPAERAALKAADAELPAAHDLDRLAYVIYTSGSTGRPKGVLISHRGLANYLGWTVQAYASAGTGGAPLFSSVAFDLGMPDLYAPLMTGQPVHLLPQDFDTADLGDLLAAGGPYAFIKLTPGHLDLLEQQLSPEQVRGLAGLVIAAGDSFTARLAERWATAAGEGGTRLAAEYGPTEITVGNSAYFLDGPVATELVPIGRAVPHTTMYVLDDRLRPLPTGVPGEVWIGGTGLARGYAGRPDLTAERFVPDPYGPPGSRLYRSGDLARVLPDGNLDFLARVDHQVKLRGYRIELGEVEAALTAHPAVAEAVAIVREDTPGDKQLVAYLVPAPGTGADDLGPAALRGHLGASLPPYMLPSAYLTLDALPLTGNGKLDRRALPAPGRAATAVGAHVEARTDAERAMAAVWARVLGLDTVGVRDNFFDLGGDSLRAVGLVGALRAAGWETSVRDVFEHRTVERLATAVARTGAPAADTPRTVARFALIDAADRADLPADVTDAYPVSRIQAGMLVEMHGGSGENRYHNITSFRIRDELPFDPAAFQRAADLIVERHEVMRTSFALAGYSQPLQLVHAAAHMPVVHEDLRHLPEDARRQALWDFADRDRAELFDLTRAPLMRMAVHLLDDESWWLSITECHPVIEGWSYHSQLMEMLRAYRALRTGGEPAPAPPAPAVRYADFIAGELRALDDPADQEFWRGIVEGHDKFTLPPGWAGDPTGPDERYRIDLPLTDLEPGLRALATAAEVPYKSVLHAAHSKVLSLLTRSAAFRGGMVVDARPEEAGAETVSGMYLNSVPFPYERTARTWGELARQVFAHEVALWPHRRYPMPAMRVPGGEAHLIDVLFHYLDFHQVDTELIDIMASRDDSPNEFPVVVGTPVRGHLSLASRTRTFSRSAADRLAGLYRAVLTEMARAGADGDSTGAFPDRYERVRLKAPALPHPETPADVLGAFEAQAARTPAATALHGEDFRLSYGELDARANRIARRLLALGAGAETRVAVLLDRGPDLVTALLGVWKAGAVQVPLDPCAPDLRFAGTAPRIAVTQRSYRFRLPVAEVLLAEDAAHDGDGSPLGLRHDPDRLAYVLHTSGSTGTPKAVEVSHRALAHYLDWAVRQYTEAGRGGAPWFTPVGFDLGMPALYAPLMTGQPVRVLPQRYATAELGPLLLRGAPYAFVGLTPGHLALLEHQLTDRELAGLAGLAVCAGDAYPTAQADRVAARIRAGGGGMSLGAEYGPTEATVAATYGPVRARSGRALVPLGAPLPGVLVRVLDAELRPVPDGVTGEVFLGGDGLARGYGGRPDLTALAFRPDPYGRPGSRLYRTGDLARRLPGGLLEFAGRTDSQVKIRGHRVEPGEAEAALTADPAVREALVTAVPAADGGKRLAAWVVPAEGRTVAVAALRDRLRTLLPAALVPAVVEVVAALPLTRNGKRDRAAVVAREATGAGAAPYAAPRTATERQLAAVWAEVLGLERVGVDDDFRELGGDSLLVPPLLVAARRAGLALDLATALRHHTVARLAAALDHSTTS